MGIFLINFDYKSIMTSNERLIEMLAKGGIKCCMKTLKTTLKKLRESKLLKRCVNGKRDFIIENIQKLTAYCVRMFRSTKEEKETRTKKPSKGENITKKTEQTVLEYVANKLKGKNL